MAANKVDFDPSGEANGSLWREYDLPRMRTFGLNPDLPIYPSRNLRRPQRGAPNGWTLHDVTASR